MHSFKSWKLGNFFFTNTQRGVFTGLRYMYTLYKALKKQPFPLLGFQRLRKTSRFLQALQWTNAEQLLNTQKSPVREQQLQKQEKCFSCPCITLHCGWHHAIFHTNTFLLTKDSKTKVSKVPGVLKNQSTIIQSTDYQQSMKVLWQQQL